MPRSTRSRTTLFLVTIVLAVCTTSLSAQVRLSPHNAVDTMYQFIKRMNYRGLLPYLGGTERERFATIVERMQVQNSLYWQLKQQSDELDGYRVRSVIVEENYALIVFDWKVVRLITDPRASANTARKQIVHIPHEILLELAENRWTIIASRAPQPESEALLLLQQPKKPRKPVPADSGTEKPSNI